MASIHWLFHAKPKSSVFARRETYCLQYLLHTPATKRKNMKIWRKVSVAWGTGYVNGKSAVIWRQLPFWWNCKRVTQNSVVSFANGIVVPRRNGRYVNEQRTENQRLANSCTMLLRPLRIKFGLMNISLKELQRNGPAFSFLCEKFPSLNTKKGTAGVFVGPHICQLCKRASIWCRSQWWREGSLECLSACCNWFFKKRKSRQIQEIVEDLITSYEKLRSSAATCHSRRISSTHIRIPFRLTVVLSVTNTISVCGRHLGDGEQRRKQSAAMLADYEGCSGNSVQTTSEKAPRLIQVSSLLCPAAIQLCNHISLKPETIP